MNTTKLLFFLFLALLAMEDAMAQWIPQYSGTQATLYSVFFTDSLTGYAAGSDGTILKTNNGGVQWISLNSGTSNTLFSVFFPVPDTGYAVGSDNILLKTCNSGLEWSDLSSAFAGIQCTFHSVFFTDGRTGYIAAGGANPLSSCGLFKTTDGGSTWNSLGWGFQNSYLSSVCFSSPDTGYAVGTYFITKYWGSYVIKTINSGLTWEKIYDHPFATELLQSVYFHPSEGGYVVGDGGVILKTIHPDTSWFPQESGTTETLYSITRSQVEPGGSAYYSVGHHGTILCQIAGNTAWDPQYSGTSVTLYSVMFPEMNTGYAVGSSGVILKTTNGGGVGIRERHPGKREVMIYPNPCTDQVTIEVPDLSKGGCFTISDIKGIERIRVSSDQNNLLLDVRTLPQGLYFLKVVGKNGVASGKFIK